VDKTGSLLLSLKDFGISSVDLTGSATTQLVTRSSGSN
jgi:hypothetical protein